jgi:hypothetical protein
MTASPIARKWDAGSTGESDSSGHAIDPAALATTEAVGNSWSGDPWNSNSSSADRSGNSWSSPIWATRS